MGFCRPRISNPALQKAETERNTEIHTPSSPYWGTKVIHKRRAPNSSKAMEVFTTIRTIFPAVSSPLELTDSWASCMLRRPIFRPMAMLIKEVRVTSPKPPTWMRDRMTTCPK